MWGKLLTAPSPPLLEVNTWILLCAFETAPPTNSKQEHQDAHNQHFAVVLPLPTPTTLKLSPWSTLSVSFSMGQSLYLPFSPRPSRKERLSEIQQHCLHTTRKGRRKHHCSRPLPRNKTPWPVPTTQKSVIFCHSDTKPPQTSVTRPVIIHVFQSSQLTLPLLPTPPIQQPLPMANITSNCNTRSYKRTHSQEQQVSCKKQHSQRPTFIRALPNSKEPTNTKAVIVH